MILAVVLNLMNNLPAGLIASTAVIHAAPPRIVTDGLLIGVNLGSNLSVTGSLATIRGCRRFGVKARTSASGAS